MKNIVLASASKRRSRILSESGIDHRIEISDVKEIMDKNLHVSQIVKKNAQMKAEEVKARCVDAVIIGADTLVSHDNVIIGKPSDEKEARFILEKFSGSEVEVYSGICVIDTSSGKMRVDADKSVIHVNMIMPEEVDTLCSLLGPYDKAGGFSIEGVGSMLFDDIEGSYFNILGLSMMKLKQMFKEIDLNILDYIKT